MARSPKSTMLPVSDTPRGGDDTISKGSSMTKRGAYAALSYMTCAVLLVLFNKAALSSYSFPCANIITLLQMVCSTCFLYAMKRLKLISFTVGETWAVSDSTALVPLKTLLHTLPLSITYLLYMVCMYLQTICTSEVHSLMCCSWPSVYCLKSKKKKKPSF
ncbi:nucleotide-sugar uncharacterized transporter 3 [Iris pallida]|uniref:Nucleotide-sugar uncharacterized transporter 3 n=1 Tax=Iris pallida TaxID=29817 RepID=A0AAX6FHD6_IRIPA|nr:nucleotide-sugar uncharacterized transporter 3 [Iris pallida]